MKDSEILLLGAGALALLWLTTQNNRRGTRGLGAGFNEGRFSVAVQPPHATYTPSLHPYAPVPQQDGRLNPTYNVDYADRIAIDPTGVPATPLNNPYSVFVPQQLAPQGVPELYQAPQFFQQASTYGNDGGSGDGGIITHLRTENV